jgi:hypothetical protein
MSQSFWKDDWETTRARYVDWWAGRGLVISMWGHLEVDGVCHEDVPAPPAPRDRHQRWFDPEWRAADIHHRLAHCELRADIVPVADTQLGPGSLAAALGAELVGGEDTIWIEAKAPDAPVVLDPSNAWLATHLELLRACRQLADGRYFVGCPDLVEGIDTLTGLRGVVPVMEQVNMDAEGLEQDLQAVNEAWFDVFERIYEIINVDGEMAFCYFSLWAPGRMAKLQCDASVMIGPDHFRRFVVPYIEQQCRWLDYSMYHLDGVGAIRHLEAVLEIKELDAVQWTPGVGQPQGGDATWYDLYRRVRAAGKSVMASWVQLDELAPLLDAVGSDGIHVLMDFKSPRDIDGALEIAERYR